mgnify:CR=1 FL=1
MIKSELIELISKQQLHLSEKDIASSISSIIDQMSAVLSANERIEIRGFGSFSINRRPPRVGRNPRSGESVMIPEKRVPHFKPGKALREAVDAGTAAAQAPAAP